MCYTVGAGHSLQQRRSSAKNGADFWTCNVNIAVRSCCSGTVRKLAPRRKPCNEKHAHACTPIETHPMRM